MTLWLLNIIPNFLIHALVITGIVAFFLASIMHFAEKFIPVSTLQIEPYLFLIKYCGLLAFIIGIFMEGVSFTNGELQQEIDRQNKEIARLDKESGKVTTQIETKYVDRVKTITKKGETRIEYVDRWITNKDNDDCKLPDSFISLHNLAAENKVPGDSNETNDSIAGTP